jgi:hypothetical protein
MLTIFEKICLDSIYFALLKSVVVYGDKIGDENRYLINDGLFRILVM